MPCGDGDAYRSRTQQARVITEAWAARNVYCAACPSPTLSALARNEPAADFQCLSCESRYQLKSSARPFGKRVVDSAYSSMMSAIRSDKAPNLLLLHYSTEWNVISLTLIPRFCITITAVQKRNPLGPAARRAGWIGCNILLDAIAPDARIPLVSDCRVSTAATVRSGYDRLRPLSQLAPALRGWTLDVLTLARSLNKADFTLAEMYSFEELLHGMHPKNLHIRPKIRQQLQVLRDFGLIEFIGPGRYCFTQS